MRLAPSARSQRRQQFVVQHDQQHGPDPPADTTPEIIPEEPPEQSHYDTDDRDSHGTRSKPCRW